VDVSIVSTSADEVKCAVSVVSGITGLSYSIIELHGTRLQTASVVVSISADFLAQAYGYSSADNAAAEVFALLSSPEGAKTILEILNAYGLSVTGVRVVLELSPTAEPTPGVKIASAGTASSSGSGLNFDVAMVIGLSIGFAFCCALAGVWYYCRYRRTKHLPKTENAKNNKNVNFNDISGVVPVEGDIVEWGMPIGGTEAENARTGFVGASDDVHDDNDSPRMKTRVEAAKQRKSDLFVI
jgi:hypothetical protein